MYSRYISQVSCLFAETGEKPEIEISNEVLTADPESGLTVNFPSVKLFSVVKFKDTFLLILLKKIPNNI